MMPPEKIIHIDRSETDKLIYDLSWGAVTVEGELNAVLVRCQCGTLLSVGDDHEIDHTGLVSPRVSCDTRGCTMHAYLKLKNWPPEELR